MRVRGGRYSWEAREAAHRVIRGFYTVDPNLVPLADLGVAALAVMERGYRSNELPWHLVVRAKLIAAVLMTNARLYPMSFVSMLDDVTRVFYAEMMRDRAGEPRRRRPRGRRRRF